MKENLTNFATSTLSASLTSSATSFSVAAGQGMFFPTSNFEVTIDSEILLISSRATDAFTVANRGYDGSTAASHLSAATVQLSLTAQHLNHLWQDVPDTHNPSVSPVQVGGSASTWDNEFESLGSWSLFPTSPAGSSTWNVTTSMFSHLLLNRVSDNTLYTAYTSFNPPASTPYSVTCKISQSYNGNQVSGTNDQAQFYLFVCDQTNPTASVTSGNRFCIKTQLMSQTQASQGSFVGTWQEPYDYQVFSTSVTSGTSRQLLPVMVVPITTPLYARIYFDGSGTFYAFFGDGFTYWQQGFSGGGFTPQTLGIQLANFVPSGGTIPGVFAIDFVRVVISPTSPWWGN